ncbi:MAG: hypothetical protein HKO93_06795 [Flavobacteriales bacterium]|nr:hypothetical protein [Flavobacteriales bacterium]
MTHLGSFSLLFITVLVLVSSCKKVDKLTQFDMEYTETVIIPSSTGIDLPFSIVQPDIESNSTSTFEANDTRKDLIEEIRLTQLDLTLTSPDNGDFDFLEEIEIFIEAEGLEEKRIAYLSEVPTNSIRFLDLTVSESDLKEFIKKDEFSLRVRTVTDETINSDHHIEVHSSFFVDAKILGQ